MRWPDWGLPLRPSQLRAALEELRRRGRTERVEVACAGGRGRTGTTLSCLAVLEGVPTREAVAYVRRHYNPHAVETPWQRLFVHWFALRTRRSS